jgi:hypothetical protein
MVTSNTYLEEIVDRGFTVGLSELDFARARALTRCHEESKSVLSERAIVEIDLSSPDSPYAQDDVYAFVNSHTQRPALFLHAGIANDVPPRSLGAAAGHILRSAGDRTAAHVFVTTIENLTYKESFITGGPTNAYIQWFENTVRATSEAKQLKPAFEHVAGMVERAYSKGDRLTANLYGGKDVDMTALLLAYNNRFHIPFVQMDASAFDSKLAERLFKMHQGDSIALDGAANTPQAFKEEIARNYRIALFTSECRIPNAANVAVSYIH